MTPRGPGWPRVARGGPGWPWVALGAGALPAHAGSISTRADQRCPYQGEVTTDGPQAITPRHLSVPPRLGTTTLGWGGQADHTLSILFSALYWLLQRTDFKMLPWQWTQLYTGLFFPSTPTNGNPLLSLPTPLHWASEQSWVSRDEDKRKSQGVLSRKCQDSRNCIFTREV